MKIFVTGGSGFIGFNLVKHLLKAGHQVVVFGRFNKLKAISHINCRYINAEFNLISEYEDEFKNVDVVYHLLSTTTPKTSNEDVVNDLLSNVKNTIHLLDICVKYKVKRFIFTSSGGTVYGLSNHDKPLKESDFTNPICAYGISKLSIEKYIYMYGYQYNLNYQILRIANPYGPYQNPWANQGAIAVFMGKVLNEQPVEIWGDGTIYRDYIYINDVVDALYSSMLVDKSNNVLNIGSGEKYSLNEILDIIKKITKKELLINYIPSRKIDAPGNILDITDAKKVLGWEPKVSIENGIAKNWEWLIDYYKYKV